MPRFLHSADWQIGRTYQRFAVEDATFLAEARLETVERIARLATERQVDAVLVAGDVFDAQTVSDRTVRRLFNSLRAYAGSWVMIPGNHDAALAASVWTRARHMDCIPPNVVLLEQPQARLLEEAGCVILAAPLTQRQTHSDLTGWFDEAPSADGLLRIGLAHGSVAGILPDAIDSGNPIAPDRARTARLDYLALGDWHGTRRIDARTWYSGTPEPDRFKDNEPGHVLLVDIPHAGAEPVVERIQVCGYRWHEWTQSLDVISDIDELERRCSCLGAGDVLALRLAGQVDLQARRRIGRLLDVTRGRVRALEADSSLLRLLPTDVDIAALAADGYVGEVLAELRAAASRGEQPQQGEVAAEAFNLLAGILIERQP